MALFSWLTRRRNVDQDLEDEIRSHLAIAEQERVTDGADRETARLAARKDFGNVTLTLDAARSVWRPRWLEASIDLMDDVRYALRILVKSPGFSLIVIAVLGVGIGLNAAVFTLFKSLALKPLAGVDGSGKLAVIMSTTSGGRPVPLSYPDYQYIRDHDRAFAGLSGSSLGMLSVGLGNHGERVFGELVTGNYFQLFGIRASLGRTILPSDEVTPGQPPVVVLSDGLWRRSFGGDPDIVGKTIHVDAFPLTVVGVADPSFHGSVVSFDTEVFIPIMMATSISPMMQGPSRDILYDRKAPIMMVFGRLRPGSSLATAAAQTTVLSAQLAADAPLQDFSQRLTVVPIWKSPFGAQTYVLPAVMVVGAMGALLLLIVSANIAGLVLVRGVARRGEIAVRLALGASRARILRLLLIENLTLAIPGAAAGLLLASKSFALLWSNAAASAPVRIFFDLSVDWMVISFAIAASCASALFFGFIPALRSSKVDLVSVMKDDPATRGAARGRFRGALVVAQVAVSLLLLIGAGLVQRSLDAARHADTGFDARNVISMTMDLKPNGYDAIRGRVFYQQLLDSARADEGIESASLAAFYPMSMVDSIPQKVAVEGYQSRRDEDLLFLNNVVAPDYFRTLRIGLVTGREFDRRDDQAATQVAVVNETLARRFWGNATSAIGKRVRVGAGDWRTIIGVARDVKYARINEDPRPYVYLPFLQNYQSNMILHRRGAAGSVGMTKLLESARADVQRIDPDLPILDAKTLSDQSNAALGTFEMTARMLVIFGFAAMGLAAMGIYGLVSYTVKRSTHEIGMRMALGAGRAHVVRRFLGRGLRLGVIGAATGIAGSYAVTRLLRALLYGVSSTDVVSFVTASAVVLGVAVVATLIPAWRASRTDPMSALRHQ